MRNPFKAVGKAVGGMFDDARNSDVAPGQAKLAAVIVTPIVVPFVFVAALFQKAEK